MNRKATDARGATVQPARKADAYWQARAALINQFSLRARSGHYGPRDEVLNRIIDLLTHHWVEITAPKRGRHAEMKKQAAVMYCVLRLQRDERLKRPQAVEQAARTYGIPAQTVGDWFANGKHPEALEWAKEMLAMSATDGPATPTER